MPSLISGMSFVGNVVVIITFCTRQTSNSSFEFGHRVDPEVLEIFPFVPVHPLVDPLCLCHRGDFVSTSLPFSRSRLLFACHLVPGLWWGQRSSSALTPRRSSAALLGPVRWAFLGSCLYCSAWHPNSALCVCQVSRMTAFLVPPPVVQTSFVSV